MDNRSLVSVVDDDESVRESLPDLLREFGFAVRAFSSAEEFLASDCLGQTRCLILDIAMPGMSGPDLQRELKLRRQEIPIIFITAHGDETVRPRVIQQGAVECLFKPFSDTALLERAQCRTSSELSDALPGGYIMNSASVLDHRIEVITHVARHANRVRRRRRHLGARIAGIADPLRRLAAGDIRVRTRNSCLARGSLLRAA